jgi:hypothetical protein
VSQPPLDVRTLLARWTVGEWVIAVASMAMIVAALLDWTTVSCHDSPLCGVAATPVTGIRGWGWLSFAGVIAILCVLLVRTVLAGEVQLPRFTVSDPVLYMGLGSVELLGCFLFWLENPSVTVGPTSIHPGPGWYLAVVAAAATVAGGRLMRAQRRPAEQLELFDRSKSTSPG